MHRDQGRATEQGRLGQGAAGGSATTSPQTATSLGTEGQAGRSQSHSGPSTPVSQKVPPRLVAAASLPVKMKTPPSGQNLPRGRVLEGESPGDRCPPSVAPAKKKTVLQPGLHAETEAPRKLPTCEETTLSPTLCWAPVLRPAPHPRGTSRRSGNCRGRPRCVCRAPVKSAWEQGVESKCISRTAVAIVINYGTNGESLEKQMLGLLMAIKHPPKFV